MLDTDLKVSGISYLIFDAEQLGINVKQQYEIIRFLGTELERSKVRPHVGKLQPKNRFKPKLQKS